MHIEFFLKNTIYNFITNGNDKPIFLFDESTMNFFKVSVFLITHIHPTVVR
jgi:hypothetical protein